MATALGRVCLQSRSFNRLFLNEFCPVYQCHRFRSVQSQKRKTVKPLTRKNIDPSSKRRKLPEVYIPDPRIETEQRLERLRKNEKIVFCFALLSLAFVIVSYNFIFTEEEGEKIRKRNEARQKALEAGEMAKQIDKQNAETLDIN